MIKAGENPWLNMKPDTARRIGAEDVYDFFWITDKQSRYGLLIKFGFPLTDIEFSSKLKGVSIVEITEDQSGKLYFVLSNNKDWEIFISLCTDLILTSKRCGEESAMIPVIKKRLKRWQTFLSENNSLSMAEIQQMGLLAELSCLYNRLLPAVGYKQAISCWVGPDFDKKDFSLADFFIEVKSFISSKGQIVKISSIHQLDHEIKPLFLVVYGLTRADTGLSIIDLITAIYQAIPEVEVETVELFESKLAAYGYMDGITAPPFYTYIPDMNKSYLVSDEFPKILAGTIDNRIITVQYTLDLAKCSSFESELPLFKL